MLSRLPNAFCSSLLAAAPCRQRVCSFTNLRDFSWTPLSVSAAPRVCSRSKHAQRLPQRLFSGLPAWDDLPGEEEHYTEYVPQPYLPDVPLVPAEQQQLLQVGVVGAPNAGKSTLTNALVGTKVIVPYCVRHHQSRLCKGRLHGKVSQQLSSYTCTTASACTNPQVSAVSPKTNTTNVPMLGAWTRDTKQVVLFDTPGVVSPK